jgi:4-amino-4-deoxy-L-arabinose transferase-like glycosyltransferase
MDLLQPTRSSQLVNPPVITFAVGGLAILVAIVTPSSDILHFLSTTPGDRLPQLLLGISLFKYSLVTFGFYLMALGWLPIWQPVTPIEKPLPDRHHHSLNRAIIVAVLCTAAVLRLYALDSGLWYDEIWTYVHYARLPFGQIITTYGDQNQHFLYSILAHASFLIFGESGWSLRLPAVLFGIGSIWALYLFAREVDNEREALLTAGLLTFSYHHVWFSQNARGYIGLLFWTLLSSWFFVRALREGRRRLWLLYAVAASLGVYTNTGMLFVLAAHSIHYVWELVARRKEIWPDRWAGLFVGFCLAGFLTVLLHAFALPQMVSGLVGEESTVPAWKQPLWALLEFMKAIRIGFAGMAVAAGAVLVFGMGLWSFTRTEPIVVELIILPVLACAPVVIGLGHHVWPRLFFFTFGFAALVAVRGAILLGQKAGKLIKISPPSAYLLGTVFATGLILVSAVSLPRAYAPKQDYLAALNFIEAEKQAGDAVTMVGLVVFTYKNLYMRDWQEVETVNELDSIRSHSKHTWLLYSFPTHVAAVYPDIMREIKKDFQIVKQFQGTVGDGSIIVTRSNQPLS